MRWVAQLDNEKLKIHEPCEVWEKERKCTKCVIKNCDHISANTFSTSFTFSLYNLHSSSKNYSSFLFVDKITPLFHGKALFQSPSIILHSFDTESICYIALFISFFFLRIRVALSSSSSLFCVSLPLLLSYIEAKSCLVLL